MSDILPQTNEFEYRMLEAQLTSLQSKNKSVLSFIRKVIKERLPEEPYNYDKLTDDSVINLFKFITKATKPLPNTVINGTIHTALLRLYYEVTDRTFINHNITLTIFEDYRKDITVNITQSTDISKLNKEFEEISEKRYKNLHINNYFPTDFDKDCFALYLLKLNGITSGRLYDKVHLKVRQQDYPSISKIEEIEAMTNLTKQVIDLMKKDFNKPL